MSNRKSFWAMTPQEAAATFKDGLRIEVEGTDVYDEKKDEPTENPNDALYEPGPSSTGPGNTSESAAPDLPQSNAAASTTDSVHPPSERHYDTLVPDVPPPPRRPTPPLFTPEIVHDPSAPFVRVQIPVHAVPRDIEFLITRSDKNYTVLWIEPDDYRWRAAIPESRGWKLIFEDFEEGGGGGGKRVLVFEKRVVEEEVWEDYEHLLDPKYRSR